MTDLQVKDNVKHIAFDILDQINEIIAKDKEIGIFVFGGDLLEVKKNIDVSVFNTLYRKLHEISQKVEMFLLKGNHDEDYIEGNNCLESMFPFAKIISNDYAVSVVENYALYFVPFGKQDNMVKWFAEAKKQCLRDQKRFRILFGHCYYDGFLVRNNKELRSRLKLTDISPESYDLCLFGDIHTYGQPFDNFYFPGTPYQRDFNDRGKTKYIFIIDDSTGKLEIEKRKLNYPEFIEIKDEYDFKVYKSRIKNGFVKNWVPELKEQIVAQNPYRIYNISPSKDKLILSDGKSDIFKFRDLIFELLKKDGNESYLAYLEQNYDLNFVGKNNIVIKEFEAVNFLSYKHLFFNELDGNEIISVVGKNYDKRDKNEPYGSNGSGKSSIFDAIVFGLFGRTIRKTKLDLIINDQEKKNCYVKILFEANNKKYIIERYRGHEKYKNDIKFKNIETGEEKTGDIRIIQKEIDEIVGFDFEQFVSTTFLGKNFEPFFEIGGTKRKEIFWKLLGLNYFDDIAKNIEDKLIGISNERGLFNSQIYELNNKIDTNREFVLNLEQTLKKNQIESEEHNLLEKNKLINDNEAFKSEMDILRVQQGKIEEYLKDILDKKNKIETKRNNTGNELYLINSKLSEINKELNNKVCPMCKRELDKTTEQKLLSERKTLEKRQKDISDTKNKIEPVYEKIRANEKVAKAKFEENRSRINTINAKIEQNNEYINEKKVVGLSSNNFDSIIKEKNSEIQSHLVMIESLKKDLSKTEYEFDQLNFWNRIFKEKILSDYILEKTFGHFERFLNKYLQGKYTCSIIFSGKLRQPELRIVEGKTKKYYDNFSEGERGEVDIASILSLFVILRTLYGGSNILLIDDLFYKLDKISTRNCVELLKNFAIENQILIYIVSQRDEIINLTDKSVIVEKRNGISEIREK